MMPNEDKSDSRSKPRYTPRLSLCIADWVLILCISVLALAPFAAGKVLHSQNASAELTAVLMVDGKEVWRQELSGLKIEITQTIEIGTKKMTICADRSGAWVETSDCPDQICVHTGKLDEVGDASVCIPFRVVLKIIATGPASAGTGSGNIDAVSGFCGGLYEKFFG